VPRWPRWSRPASREPPRSEGAIPIVPSFNSTSPARDRCANYALQCDEAHPTCRNCQKSKRECLGYDPIFKQQPGPPQIQPAPNSTPHQASIAASSPPITAPYPTPVPQGYAPAVSAGPYAPPVSSSGTSQAGHANFSSPAIESTIDPALARQDPSMHRGQPQYNGAHAPYPMTGTASAYPSAPVDAPVIKGQSYAEAPLLC
jgi:hypothetical protein